MKKIIISKIFTNEEKVKEYKRSARVSQIPEVSYKSFVELNKKRNYDKRDKSYKSDY